MCCRRLRVRVCLSVCLCFLGGWWWWCACWVGIEFACLCFVCSALCALCFECSVLCALCFECSVLCELCFVCSVLRVLCALCSGRFVFACVCARVSIPYLRFLRFFFLFSLILFLCLCCFLLCCRCVLVDNPACCDCPLTDVAQAAFLVSLPVSLGFPFSTSLWLPYLSPQCELWEFACPTRCHRDAQRALLRPSYPCGWMHNTVLSIECERSPLARHGRDLQLLFNTGQLCFRRAVPEHVPEPVLLSDVSQRVRSCFCRVYRCPLAW